MGNPITQSIKEKQEKNELEVTETLQMMHKMMENRIAAASSQVGAKNGYHRSIRTRTRRVVSSTLTWNSEFFLSFQAGVWFLLHSAQISSKLQFYLLIMPLEQVFGRVRPLKWKLLGSIFFIVLGPVLGKLISINPGLNLFRFYVLPS